MNRKVIFDQTENLKSNSLKEAQGFNQGNNVQVGNGGETRVRDILFDCGSCQRLREKFQATRIRGYKLLTVFLLIIFLSGSLRGGLIGTFGMMLIL